MDLGYVISGCPSSEWYRGGTTHRLRLRIEVGELPALRLAASVSTFDEKIRGVQGRAGRTLGSASRQLYNSWSSSTRS